MTALLKYSWLCLASGMLVQANCQDSFARPVFAAIDKNDDGLRALNREIWENPETAFQEFHAHKVLTDYLEEQGFNVTRNAHGLETSFRAEYSNGGGRTVSFNSEYDALPGIGHACGHNLIAVAGVGAAIGVKEALENHNLKGRVVLLGTPAEEGGGGKIKMLEAGAYDDVDCSLMTHPGNSWYSNYAPSLASWRANVTWTGYGAHAALSPWQGRNALDGFVSAYTMTALYRQQMRPDERIHHVIVDGSGMIPNQIPDYIRAVWGARASTLESRSRLVDQVYDIVEASAKATNTSVDLVPFQDYWNLVPNQALSYQYYHNHMTYFDPTKNNATAGFQNDHPDKEIESGGAAASSDQGNVSWKVPAIQTGFPIGGSAPNHNSGFTELAGTDFAHRQAMISGKTLAMTGIEVLRNETFAKLIWEEWRELVGSQQ
ncbi:hypothetical protein B0I35DRAFT_453045 [Stachybotrys elegans]|uniref:Peptidase M20 domain-containing protein 2 n=1 Tax=Stachybotrys elegans TaxID=80388 RepID=A0A8K0WNM1_9HYPO|nr:hypothetical protein B0I35DRAFT_453045 [Stachybotrys elegans]